MFARQYSQMKNFTLLISFLITLPMFSQVGIGTVDPDESSILEVVSSNKGVILPKVSLTGTSDISTIANPKPGLLVYNTANVVGLNVGYTYWDGSQWSTFLDLNSLSDDWTLQGNSITGSEFLGTTNAQPLNFKVENIDVGSIKTNSSLNLGRASSSNGDRSSAFGFESNAGGAESVALGRQANSSGARSSALGFESKAVGDESVALGRKSTSSGARSSALGFESVASGDESVALGRKSTASGNRSTAVGFESIANKEESIALGRASEASGLRSTSLGFDSTASGDDSIALGRNAGASSLSTISIGYNSSASSNSAIAIGEGTISSSSNSISIGNAASTTDGSAIAIGSGASSIKNSTISLGVNAEAKRDHSISIGINTKSDGFQATALGAGAQANAVGSTAIGRNAVASGVDAIVLGSDISRVGIGTSSPDNTTKLHVAGKVKIVDGTQGADRVLTSDANGVANWQNNVGVTKGDVKNGFQPTDHNGWYKLDGRSISELPANAQTAAAALGFSANLPNATNRVLKARNAGEAMGSQVGSNSLTLAAANIPQLTGTTNNNGAHTHNVNNVGVRDIGVDRDNDNDSFGITANDATTTSNGNHNHTVTIGNATPAAINNTPASIVTNVFVYLGN